MSRSMKSLLGALFRKYAAPPAEFVTQVLEYNGRWFE